MSWFDSYAAVMLLVFAVLCVWLAILSSREATARLRYFQDCQKRAVQAWNLFLEEVNKDKQSAKAQNKRQRQRKGRAMSKNSDCVQLMRRIRVSRRVF